MVVIVYHGLPNMQSRLTYEVLQFLPAAVGGNLPSQSDKSRSEISRIESAYSLEEHNEFIIRSAGSWTASLFPAKKRHSYRQISKSLVPMMGSGSCCSPNRRCSFIQGTDGSGVFVVRQTMAVFSILKGHRRCETVGVQLVRPGCGRLGLQLEQLLCSQKNRCWGFTVSAGHSRHQCGRIDPYCHGRGERDIVDITPSVKEASLLDTEDQGIWAYLASAQSMQVNELV